MNRNYFSPTVLDVVNQKLGVGKAMLPLKILGNHSLPLITFWHLDAIIGIPKTVTTYSVRHRVCLLSFRSESLWKTVSSL